MIKIWHIARAGDPYGGSRNANKILLALDEIGELYQTQLLSRESDVRPADGPYRKLNPNGVVPAIDDSGLVLWESGAILRHLADSRPGKGLLSEDLREKAIAQQWLTWEGATLTPSLHALFFAAMAQPPNEQATEAARAAYLANLRILDAQLAGKSYIANTFSIADIALGSLVPLSFALGLDLKPYPNLLAWLKRLRGRPVWSKNEIFAADIAAGEAQFS